MQVFKGKYSFALLFIFTSQISFFFSPSQFTRLFIPDKLPDRVWSMACGLQLHQVHFFWSNYLENFGSKLDYEGSPGFRVNLRFLLMPENPRQTLGFTSSAMKV